MTEPLTIGVLEDERVTGLDGPTLAAAISLAMHDRSPVAYLANVTAIEAGIRACAAAAAADAPLLLTGPTSLPDATCRELERLGAESVVIVGDHDVVDAEIEDELTARGFDVSRLADDDAAVTRVTDRFVANRLRGRDRIARSIALAIATLPPATPVYVADDNAAVVVHAPDRVPIPAGRVIDALSPSIVAVMEEP